MGNLQIAILIINLLSLQPLMQNNLVNNNLLFPLKNQVLHYQETTNKVKNEILAFREMVKEVIRRKDKAKLDEIYREDFNHIHASGKTDSKTARIKSLLKGEITIESSPETELTIRTYNTNAALVTGISKIFSKEKKATLTYRWTTLYIKDSDKWSIAASQATQIVK